MLVDSADSEFGMHGDECRPQLYFVERGWISDNRDVPSFGADDVYEEEDILLCRGFTGSSLDAYRVELTLSEQDDYISVFYWNYRRNQLDRRK